MQPMGKAIIKQFWSTYCQITIGEVIFEVDLPASQNKLAKAGAWIAVPISLNSTPGAITCQCDSGNDSDREASAQYL